MQPLFYVVCPKFFAGMIFGRLNGAGGQDLQKTQ